MNVIREPDHFTVYLHGPPSFTVKMVTDRFLLIVDDPLKRAGEALNAENVNALVLYIDGKEKLAELYRIIGDALAIAPGRA